MSSGRPAHRLVDRTVGSGLIPDPVLRWAARRAAGSRLAQESEGGVEAGEERLGGMIEWMGTGPIAEQVEAANTQHYEVPGEFFRLFLGPRMKYSSCLWAGRNDSLAEAEDRMLEVTCRRAGIEDGMRVLDLGCGWGSLSLWIASNFPGARVTAVSNSNGQRELIEEECTARGLYNVEVITTDINAFRPDDRFDRVVSVEMFEHLRNWRELLGRVAGWLEDEGRMFLHVFSNRLHAYRFTDSWFAGRFFTAGMMPSHDLALMFPDQMAVERRWAVEGTHYARTLAAWLTRLDANRERAIEVLGGDRAAFEAWRVFLIAARETWAYGNGQEWLVSHYLMRPAGAGQPA